MLRLHWTRGVDVNERTVTTHSIWPLYVQLFFLSLWLATSWPKLRFVKVYVLNFTVTVLLLATKTALYTKRNERMIKPVGKMGQLFSFLHVQGVKFNLQISIHS